MTVIRTEATVANYGIIYVFSAKAGNHMEVDRCVPSPCVGKVPGVDNEQTHTKVEDTEHEQAV